MDFTTLGTGWSVGTAHPDEGRGNITQVMSPSSFIVHTSEPTIVILAVVENWVGKKKKESSRPGLLSHVCSPVEVFEYPQLKDGLPTPQPCC